MTFVLVFRVGWTIVLALGVALFVYGLSVTAPLGTELPFFNQNGFLVGLIIGIGVGIYIVWLNRDAKPRRGP